MGERQGGRNREQRKRRRNSKMKSSKGTDRTSLSSWEN
jgi:hypothetical protein